jgi:hypothetical protein
MTADRMTIIITVLTTLVVAIQAITIARSLSRIKRKKRAENSLERVIVPRIVADGNLRRKIRYISKALAAPHVDIEDYMRACKLLDEYIKRLNEDDRNAVLEGITQPSPRGRVNYVNKIMDDCLEEAAEERAMAASR